jgi:two-component system, NtrC family, response regulator AtoC
LNENRNPENRTLGIPLPDHKFREGRELFPLLAVSRDSAVLRLLWELEESNPWRFETAVSGWEAMDRLQSGALPRLLMLEVARGDSESFYFLRWMRRLHSEMRVLFLCHPENAAQAKEELGTNEGEVLVRPCDGMQLEMAIRRQLSPGAVAEDSMGSVMVSKETESLGHEPVFICASLAMQKLRAQAALMAKTDAPVLILGERGSGKFTVACLIHSLSVRSGFKLRRIHCAQMPESVIEAELLRASADAGTATRTVGCEKGTIFFDEITALPPSQQARLLQILEDQESRESESENRVAAQVRILAASSIDVELALAKKWLREDLYYRLSAFTVHVPALRQRKDEISTLLRYFMHKLTKHYSLPPRSYSVAVLDACQRYSWPGNLKEMESFVKRYLVAGDQELALQEMFVEAEPSADNETKLVSPRRWSPEAADESEAEEKPLRPMESLKSLIQNVKSEAEKNAIRAALKTTGWNRKAAARLLRVSYRTLLYKIEQYQMRAPEPFLSSFRSEELLSYEEVKGNGKAS